MADLLRRVPHFRLDGGRHVFPLLSDCENRRILIYERADQFEILSRIPTTYMWTSPEPRAILEQWGLVQKKCSSNRRYRDVLIYPRRYTLTEYDRLFIDKLFDARNDIAFGNR